MEPDRAAEVIDQIRQAGVRRGIKASITVIENLRERHNKRSSGYHDLSLALDLLSKLTIEDAEEV